MPMWLVLFGKRVQKVNTGVDDKLTPRILKILKRGCTLDTMAHHHVQPPDLHPKSCVLCSAPNMAGVFCSSCAHFVCRRSNMTSCTCAVTLLSRLFFQEYMTSSALVLQTAHYWMAFKLQPGCILNVETVFPLMWCIHHWQGCLLHGGEHTQGAHGSAQAQQRAPVPGTEGQGHPAGSSSCTPGWWWLPQVLLWCEYGTI